MKICVLVEQNRRQEIEKILEPTGWDALFMPCDESAATMAVELNPEWFLIDEIMINIDSFEICKRIRELPSSSDMPILMLSAAKSKVDDLDVLRFGIDNMIP